MRRPRLAELRLTVGGWRLRRRVGAFFALLALVLAALVTASVLSLVFFVHNGNQVVDRWAPATASGRQLLADLVNQETGVRGYALSGDKALLQPFTEYSAAQQRDRRTLARLVGDDAHLMAALAAFDRAAGAWRAQVAIPVISLVNGADPSAPSLADSAASLAQFDSVRRAAAALIADLDHESDAAEGARRAALVALCVSLAVSLGVLLAGAAVAWRGLHVWVLAPVDRLAAQTRRVVAGEGGRAIRPVGPPELRSLAKDVERMRRRIARELERTTRAGEDLARSNADLEQFAYVASHDLSEPLRKISNFCQLLERQYAGQLDDRAREYIAYAVDGAKRMQALIADMLTLSRVGRDTDGFVPVDANHALASALAALDDQIASSGGGVGYSELPTVTGDPTLIASLFENLVGNAVKYRGDDPPLVVVTATAVADEPFWMFAVSDNGIGIAPQYAERVFALFQRLHLRDAYAGTGIGLALCRKIVDFHGGRIWLDTSVSAGATFRFTLPREVDQ